MNDGALTTEEIEEKRLQHLGVFVVIGALEIEHLELRKY